MTTAWTELLAGCEKSHAFYCFPVCYLKVLSPKRCGQRHRRSLKQCGLTQGHHLGPSTMVCVDDVNVSFQVNYESLKEYYYMHNMKIDN